MRHLKTTSASGNALFLILIAVALFAALSYAVTSSSRGGGSVNKEHTILQAAAITAQGALMKQTVQRMLLTGTDIGALSFEDVRPASYTNAACTTSDCKVFSTQNSTYAAPLDEWLDTSFAGLNMWSFVVFGNWYFSGNLCVQDLPAPDGVSCTTLPDAPDLVAILPAIRKDICIEINRSLGIDNPGGNPPVDNGCDNGAPYTGSLSQNVGIGDASAPTGKWEACYQTNAGCPTGPSRYNYYQALYAQ